MNSVGFIVDVKPSIAPSELKKTVPNYDVLIVRSRTKVNKDVLKAGTRLKAVGRAGGGLDNIDIKAAQEKGLKILNTPEAPAEAVAELTLGLILCLARNIPYADRTMKEGTWIKKELMG